MKPFGAGTSSILDLALATGRGRDCGCGGCTLLSIPAGDVGRKSETVRFRRALGLLAMTLVLPGMAQLTCGSKAVGRAALRIVGLVVLTVVIGYAILGKHGVIKLGLNTAALTTFEVAVVVLGLCWLALFVDAWRLGRPPSLRRPHRFLSAGLSLTLMAGVTTPLAYGAYLIDIQRNLVNGVLVHGGIGDLYNGRLNIALLGGDGGLDRVGVRTDSISLVSIDMSTGKSVLFSLPRNLRYVQFPPGTVMAKKFPNGFPDFAYGIYTWALANKGLFPGVANPGALVVEQALAQTLGIPVHYYALVNLQGFQDIVDAIGGVTIRVDERLPIGGGHETGVCDLPGGGCREGKENPILGWIEPGLQHLNGYRALWYARSRATTTDYDRMRRQKCLMGAILKQANPLTVLENYSKLAGAAHKVLLTDLTTGAVDGLLGVADKARKQSFTSVQFTNQVIDPDAPDLSVIRAKVQQAIAASDAIPVVPATPSPTPTAKATHGKTKAKPKPTPTKAPQPTVPGAAQSVDATCQYS
jgi:LCP family protein required for cell wall assembly